MENKKPTSKLIIIFVTLFALSALILFIIFCCTNSKKDVSPVSFIEEIQENEDENKTSADAKNGIGAGTENKGTTTNETNTTDSIEMSGTSGTGQGNGTFSGNDNASSGNLIIDENGNGQIGISGNQSSGTGPGFVQDENGSYSADVEMENNSQIDELISKDKNNDYTPGYEDDDNSGKPKIKEYDDWNLSVEGNEYNNLPIKLNLLNAPYNNNEYCEGMLGQKSFDIKLTSKPGNATITGYPEKVTINNDGKLNLDRHVYTKTGNIDLSNTKFSQLGDYIFSIYEENSDQELYQIIVTLRGITLEDGTPLGKNYSMIQIKSLVNNGEKVNSINININNPNTYITVDKKKNVNSFWEQVYVDVYIDSYENERYTVVNGNSDDKSSSKIGDHYVVRTQKHNIIPQTYKMANDGKVIIGKKSASRVSSILKIASTNGLEKTNVTKTNEVEKFEIPAGTKYKVEFSAEKHYREDYDIEGGGEFRVAREDAEENEVKISNITSGNPKTGVFFTIIPFVIVIGLAVIGVIIIKKTSIKDTDDDK